MSRLYNEDLNVVKNIIYASLGIDWPKDKLNIWILDDGGREEFRQFAQNVGVKYSPVPLMNMRKRQHQQCAEICQRRVRVDFRLRPRTNAIVPANDHGLVPERETAGDDADSTPLLLAGPVERNLGRFRKTPNEGTLFYGLVQDGNDMWDATFFCGSCAVIRRKPLDEIGGIAVETVTEDAQLTSLRLHRRGYTSAYMRIPQAAGLATESLSAHIGQRIRWARGMVQISVSITRLPVKG